jgi:hypothetical protein
MRTLDGIASWDVTSIRKLLHVCVCVQPKKRVAPERKTSAKRQQTSKSQAKREAQRDDDDGDADDDDDEDDSASDTIENGSTVSDEEFEMEPEPVKKVAPARKATKAKPAAAPSNKRADGKAKESPPKQEKDEESSVIDLTTPIPTVAGLGNPSTGRIRRLKPQPVPPTPVREYEYVFPNATCAHFRPAFWVVADEVFVWVLLLLLQRRLPKHRPFGGDR